MMANMETLTAMDALAYANINVTGRDEIISILRQHAQGMKMYVLAIIVAFCTSLDALLVRLFRQHWLHDGGRCSSSTNLSTSMFTPTSPTAQTFASMSISLSVSIVASTSHTPIQTPLLTCPPTTRHARLGSSRLTQTSGARRPLAPSVE